MVDENYYILDTVFTFNTRWFAEISFEKQAHKVIEINYLIYSCGSKR